MSNNLTAVQRPKGNRTAELYDSVWQRGLYHGFSRGTAGEVSTPFLDLFADRLHQQEFEGRRLHIMELGAGSCDHAIHLGSDGFDVTAVEYSRAAVTPAIERLAQHRELSKRVRIVQANLFDHVNELSQNSLDGVYANAVLHFLSREERKSLYACLRKTLIRDGILAVSFKCHGDAIECRGRLVDETTAGPIVEGEDGITRLFVSDLRPLAKEISDAGFRPVGELRWSVLGYNIEGEDGKFIGLLATCEKAAESETNGVRIEVPRRT